MTTWAHARVMVAPSFTFEIDKSAWGDGPWKVEPDAAVWYDLHTGLKCQIARNPGFGSLLGYVQIPWWVPNNLITWVDAESAFEVHGGVTFLGEIYPKANKPPGKKFIGFDCAHGSDVSPVSPVAPDLEAVFFNKEYRTWEYVTENVTSLARQVMNHYTQKVLE